MVIRPDLTVDVLRRDLGEVRPDESPAAVFRFARETGQPFALRLARPLPPYLETGFIREGKGTSLVATLRAERIPPGQTAGLEVLDVDTSEPLEPRFTLYVEWKLRQPVEPRPSRIVFQDRLSRKATLRLASRDGRPFTVADARVEGGGFRVGPLPARAPVAFLDVERTCESPARATLVIRIQGEVGPLLVPLAFLP
jgi:hypothetical protein